MELDSGAENQILRRDGLRRDGRALAIRDRQSSIGCEVVFTSNLHTIVPPVSRSVLVFRSAGDAGMRGVAIIVRALWLSVSRRDHRVGMGLCKILATASQGGTGLSVTYF